MYLMIIQFTKWDEEASKDQEKWLGAELKLGGTVKGERIYMGREARGA